ncbi:hypothetical protein [Alkalibacillus salilacus]|uniref:DUF3221 domain-containing protein n=1 Tax=Alkalibacillus salilacus TaxID=284582 RepID=A0ABT9VHL6_9BACI|nr:hypothetical protein [Alkalibacillus salilacus]MDQ0160447.1 hypothetical protein [Alkalibacillus salilacus]
MRKNTLSVVLFLSIMMVACSNQTTENVIDNPTPEEILEENMDADILVVNGVVYKNAEEIEWVNEEELTIGEEVGEIKKQTNNIDEFEDYTANKLPVGTKVYEPEEKSNIYIVKTNDKEVRYLGLIEG